MEGGQRAGGRRQVGAASGWGLGCAAAAFRAMVQCPAGRGDEGELLGEGVCVGGGQRERERNLKPLMGP